MSWAILTDTTRCTGCDRCVDACVEANHLGADTRYPWRQEDGLSGERFCSVLRLPDYRYVRLQCRHCLEPACAAVCPVGALEKTDEGPIVYHPDICMGCRYCMMACPYGIPRYQWERSVPYIRKCTMCYDAVERGEIEQPACTSACPEKATVFFSSREEALEEARRRIAASPGRYFENRVWGEHEVGGTGVLYLSDFDLEPLASHRTGPLGNEPYPAKTNRIMATVPGTFVGVSVLMAGTFWVIRRRQEVMGAEQREREAAGTSQGPGRSGPEAEGEP